MTWLLDLKEHLEEERNDHEEHVNLGNSHDDWLRVLELSVDESLEALLLVNISAVNLVKFFGEHSYVSLSIESNVLPQEIVAVTVWNPLRLLGVLFVKELLKLSLQESQVPVLNIVGYLVNSLLFWDFAWLQLVI